MMDAQVARRATARHTAAAVVACKHLLTHPRRDRRRDASGMLGIHITEMARIALCALDQRTRDIEQPTCSAHSRALAGDALLECDLVRRPLSAGARIEEPPAQRIHELCVRDLATALLRERAACIA